MRNGIIPKLKSQHWYNVNFGIFFLKIDHFFMELDKERVGLSDSLKKKKFQQAGIGFFVFNVIYFCMFFWLLPPFNLGWLALIIAFILLFLNVITAYYIYKCGRKLALIMIFIFGVRALHSCFRLYTGEAFMAVPYVLPFILATFYLLGRATWDWR